jgi:hypothetical protein
LQAGRLTVLRDVTIGTGQTTCLAADAGKVDVTDNLCIGRITRIFG